jgi:hypothetical protein
MIRTAFSTVVWPEAPTVMVSAPLHELSTSPQTNADRSETWTALLNAASGLKIAMPRPSRAAARTELNQLRNEPRPRIPGRRIASERKAAASDAINSSQVR